MPVTELKALLKHELGDLLFAERTFLKGTRKMAKETSDPVMRERLEAHATETEGQIRRLEEAFRAMGERPKAEKCEAALGLVEEHDSFVSEEEPSKEILEAFDLGSGLRVEHYEIAAYRSAIVLAMSLGQQECAGLLRENLAEEEAMAKFIERSAAKTLKAVGRAVAASQAEESAGATKKSATKKPTAKKSAGSTARKSTASKGTAKKSGGSKTAAKSG
ncbi:MAG TPA: DUF892 family protein [Longimicrobiaceae bacterium]|nr:DUF892 family protein [Longimicrobiaceae bacterium]